MIYILNCYPVLESGHFWHQDFYFRKFFRALGFTYSFINPSAKIAKNEDELGESSDYRYFEIENASHFVSLAKNYITNDLQSQKFESACLFFPWLPQFSEEELKEFASLNSITKLSIFGVSVRNPNSIWGGSPEVETFVHQNLFLQDPYKIIWIGEAVPEYLLSSKQVRYLPEYAETKINRETKKEFDIGFFGMLSPYRGLFEVLVLALLNPKLRIIIRGYGFAPHRIWRPIKFKFFRYTGWKDNFLFSLFFSSVSLPIGWLRFLPNIEFFSKPFPTENDLDLALGACNAVLYCPKLPHGSGLMTKSLSAGIPILWNGLPGQAFDFLTSNYIEGNFHYWEIFLPGRITKKLKAIAHPEPQESQMWNNVLTEITEFGKYV